MRPVHLPRDLGELWAALENEPEAALYAGGTDLLVKLRQGIVPAPALICLERIEDLKRIEDRPNEVVLGAGATHAQLLDHPAVRRHCPVLVKALSVLGSPPIRHMGTIGGNLVTASPAGDSLPPLYVLKAEVEVRSRERTRRTPVSEFIQGPGQVDLRPGEIVAAVHVPKPDRFNLHHFEKVGRRAALAIAVASLAAILAVSDQGEVQEARLAWGSVGPTVIVSPAAEEALINGPLTPERLEAAADLAREAVRPIDDLRATAAYRRQVSGNLVRRLADPIQFSPAGADPGR
jgi:CO/xanthine dehydrogenase FAD-binding subunit